MKKLQLNIQKISDDPPVIDLDEIARFTEAGGSGNYEITVKKAVKNKSQKQLGVIFGFMMAEIIAQCNDEGIDVSDLLVYLIDGNIPKGQGITKDFLHELMYVICPTTDSEGRRVTLSKMSTVQASELFERFRTILAPLGINIQDPYKNWRDSK